LTRTINQTTTQLLTDGVILCDASTVPGGDPFAPNMAYMLLPGASVPKVPVKVWKTDSSTNKVEVLFYGPIQPGVSSSVAQEQDDGGNAEIDLTSNMQPDNVWIGSASGTMV
jgi:hypothetical protein